MQFKKIFLSAALISMAGFVACGDDSSSGGDDTLPEKVKTIKEANDLKCDESVKCAKVFVEEEIVNDYFQCDGENFMPATDAKFKDLCPAKEEEKGSEDDEEGKTEGDDNKAPESSASETTSTDSGAESTDSNTESTDSSEGGEDSEGGEEVTGPTGDLVSCTMEFFGEKTCDEVAKADEAGLSAQCEAMGGTMNTDGGCKAEDYAAKCTCKKGNHYDSSCEGFTCKD